MGKCKVWTFEEFTTLQQHTEFMSCPVCGGRFFVQNMKEGDMIYCPYCTQDVTKIGGSLTLSSYD